jgi:hypothetical protein
MTSQPHSSVARFLPSILLAAVPFELEVQMPLQECEERLMTLKRFSAPNSTLPLEVGIQEIDDDRFAFEIRLKRNVRGANSTYAIGKGTAQYQSATNSTTIQGQVIGGGEILLWIYLVAGFALLTPFLFPTFGIVGVVISSFISVIFWVVVRFNCETLKSFIDDTF